MKGWGRRGWRWTRGLACPGDGWDLILWVGISELLCRHPRSHRGLQPGLVQHHSQELMKITNKACPASRQLISQSHAGPWGCLVVWIWDSQEWCWRGPVSQPVL